MKQCTHDGLLTGGPHNAAHGVTTCVHHTFTHIKALAVMLDHGRDNLKQPSNKTELPREQVYGYRFFSDIQTGLIAKGNFRATVTGYDREYKKDKNGHATGGALTMLWHPLTGPILSASMNDYQLFEAGNMMVDNDPDLMPLTPRLELKQGGNIYMNISDLSAIIEMQDIGNDLLITTKSKLLDKDQKSPDTGEITCEVTYIFSPDKVTFKFKHNGAIQDKIINTIIPIIAKFSEKAYTIAETTLHISKERSAAILTSNRPFHNLDINNRMYNPVPGLEAIPITIAQNNVVIEIRVKEV